MVRRGVLIDFMLDMAAGLACLHRHGYLHQYVFYLCYFTQHFIMFLVRRNINVRRTIAIAPSSSLLLSQLASECVDKNYQSTESADFDKLDGWIVNRAGYFDIKQTWSAWVFFLILIGSNKNILMDKCTFHVLATELGIKIELFDLHISLFE